MKSMALIITVLALSVPFAANASDWTISEQLASNTSLSAEAGSNPSHDCKVCQVSGPDSDPYVIRD